MGVNTIFASKARYYAVVLSTRVAGGHLDDVRRRIKARNTGFAAQKG